MNKNKSYVDYFIENEFAKEEKKKNNKIYFGQVHEDAIVKFNDPETSEAEKLTLFYDFVEPGLKRIISGVLEMPMFHNLGKMDRVSLVEGTFYRLVYYLNRFTPGRVGKNGQPVKAFSYLSTIAKHYVLNEKERFEKFIKNKSDVETSIDITILSEETLKKLENQDQSDIEFDQSENSFELLRAKVISKIEQIINLEIEKLDKKDDNVIKIGYYLRYIIRNWHIFQFTKKNEFMRLLVLFSGLKQQVVSHLYKRFIVAIFPLFGKSNINLSETSEYDAEIDEVEADDEIEDDEIDIIPEDDNLELNLDALTKPKTKKKKKEREHYLSMEEFEALENKKEQGKTTFFRNKK